MDDEIDTRDAEPPCDGFVAASDGRSCMRCGWGEEAHCQVCQGQQVYEAGEPSECSACPPVPVDGERPDTAALRNDAAWVEGWCHHENGVTDGPKCCTARLVASHMFAAADALDALAAPVSPESVRIDRHLLYTVADIARQHAAEHGYTEADKGFMCIDWTAICDALDLAEGTDTRRPDDPAPVSPDGPGEVIRTLAAQAFTNSERWFPDSHAQGSWPISLHMALGIGGEAGEILDVIKKADVCGGLTGTCDKHAPGKHDRTALGSEMADLFTYLLNLAHHHGIDLVAEFEAKQAICAERWDR